MVYFSSIQDISQAYQHMVGIAAYADPVHQPDTTQAVTRANLQPGESVLEIGSGSGRLIASAKQQVGNGFCVAVDATQGFLQHDIPWQVQQQGLAVYPQGAPDKQVHLMHVNATDGALRQRLQALPSAPSTFDCIFVLHVLNTIPPGQRRQVLVALRRLLTPSTGRLIITMSARFTDTLPLAAEVDTPVQFRTSAHTESLGSLVLCRALSTGSVATPRGQINRKVVAAAMQFSPDRLWTVAHQQARAAVEDAGFHVNASFPVGKGDCFGLPTVSHSDSWNTLHSMSLTAIQARIQQVDPTHGYNCVGRANEAVCRLSVGTWHAMPPWRQDCALVKRLQATATPFINGATVLSLTGQLPAGVVAQKVEHTQVGVMLMLGKN